MKNVGERKTGVLSIVSLVFGILAIVFMVWSLFVDWLILSCIITAISSLITGIVAICLKNKIVLPVIGITLSTIALISVILIIIGMVVYNVLN